MEILLQQDESFVIGDDARKVTILCTAGLVWVTQEGDARDHFLNPGQRFRSDATGKVIVEARREATLKVERREEAAGILMHAAQLA